MVFGDGEQTRDFTFVADTARGIRLAAAARAAVGDVINLGSGHEVTVNALAERIAALVGVAPAVQHDASRPGDVRRLSADASRAARLLGWRAEVGLDDGLARTLAWYRACGITAERLLADEVVRAWEADGR